MAQKDFLSSSERDVLRALLLAFKDHYRFTSENLASYAGINIHALRNFLSGKDPRAEVISQLCSYVVDKFLSGGDLPPELPAEMHQQARQLIARFSSKTPTWSGQLHSLFPDIHEELTCPVPDKFSGTYVIYRHAAVGGEVVRASLVITPGDPTPTFLNAYYDSLLRKRKTKGFVFSMGTALQLLGHIAPFPTLKLITFDWPEDCKGNALAGLTISNDFRNQFFASRCVAIREKADAGDERSSNAADVPSDLDTGVFSHEEARRRDWYKQYEKIASALDNTVKENAVMFLSSASIRELDQGA